MYLTGRIQIVKMNILPRYLYLFRFLPIFLPRSFFNAINSSISSFIWAGQHARANKSLLQRNRSLGGLGLPNLLGDYWAANTQMILLWFIAPQRSWCQLEAGSCSSSLQSLACSTLPLSLPSSSCNPIGTNTLKIWFQIRRQLGWLTPPQATPICNNHLFLPSKIDPRFRYFESQGLQCLGDLYIDGLFANFQQ